MAYKKIDEYFSFADIAVQNHADKNRSLMFLQKIDRTIDWQPIEALLKKFYEPGKTNRGERAYSPLLLFKCLLLQKWFQVKSDPELESQINDRISFKSFLNLPMDYPSPDHSTFSRFRKRLSKEAMIQINSALLKQFHSLGLAVNQGVAVDARLVKSASRPVSKGQLEELKNTLFDKNGNPKKFCRDVDSDWTIKNDEPHYGLKEHAAVDTDNGFVLSVNLSPASHHDSKYFPYAICYSMHTSDPIENAFGDKGYTGAPNREFLALNNIGDGIMRKDNINAKLTDFEIDRNKAISKYRYIVEQYFGISHKYDNGNRARFTTLFKNLMDLMYRQFAFNLRKGSKLLGILTV